MKKLFFITLFSVGLFAVSNAQVMTYELNNVSGVDWKFGMDDAGPSAVIYHYIPAATPPITGAIFPFFTFPLGMKTGNGLGCGGSTSAMGVGPGNISMSGLCAINTGVFYNITNPIPFIHYHMDLIFI